MSVAKLSSYAEELVKKSKDPKARNYARNRTQKLGFNKKQTYALILAQASGRRVMGRDPVKKLSQFIKENHGNTKSLRLKLFRKELRKLGVDYLTIEATYVSNFTYASKELCEDRGFDISNSPSMQNLIDIMITLCMRPADVKGLCINYYKQNSTN